MEVLGNPSEGPLPQSGENVPRLIVLGASNVAKSLGVLAQVAQQQFQSPLDIVTATGRGRSYGHASWYLARSLPSILSCEIWDYLASQKKQQSYAVITDVGNDLLYEFSADQIAQWVEQCVVQLKEFTNDIVLSGLPIHNVKQISPAKFLLFRTIFFPRTKIPISEVQSHALRLHDYLRSIAARHQIHFVPVKESWYSVDPIHWKIAARPEVWDTLLEPLTARRCDRCLITSKLSTELSYWFCRQKSHSMMGVTRVTPQPNVRLESGTTIALY